MNEKAKVLIVDDEEEILDNLDRLLSSEGYACTTLQEPLRFREVRDEIEPDVLITDLRMPGADGMTILAAARADDPMLPVILITGFASISSAVEAVQEGAFDYLSKPFSAEQLFVAVDRAARHRGLVAENQSLREQVDRHGTGSEVIGNSPVFARVLDQVRRVAPTDANVLITGESGTGKEVVARLVHDRSRRADGPFMPVDCAALPEGILESELFGHHKGAFTGAVARRTGLLQEADGGTVFLDEIGEMSMPLQAKLLRALEQRQVRLLGGSTWVDLDVRVVAATNVDLDAAVAEGRFREDLYYRLNVVHLRMPSLRERPSISPEAWEAMERFGWPGNIRQLRNVMHRLVALDDDGKVTVADLPPEIARGQTRANGRRVGTLPLDYQLAKEMATQEFMEAYLDRLLDSHGGNVSRAAKSAGVSRRTLHRWLAEFRQEAE